jgi:hypothetical protein
VPNGTGSGVSAGTLLAMAGNPKTSKWRNTPNALRKRKQGKITMSDEAWNKLGRLAAKHEDKTKSAVVEDLILNAKEKT